MDRQASAGEPGVGAGPLVHPTREDAVLRAASEGVGGPVGRHAGRAASWWTPVRVLLALTAVVFALGVIERGYCHDIAWSRGDGRQYVHACYSDIPHLYRERGFAEGKRPYLDEVAGVPQLEYPVLTGAVMWAGAALVRPVTDGIDAEAVRFYDLTALLLGVAAGVTVVATTRLAGGRPWDAATVAVAPVLALSGTINWDLLAVALATLGMLAWARRRPVAAGVLIGLATAAKLYPVIVLFAWFCLCARAGRLAAFARAAAAAAVAWLVVNAPIALAAPDGWWTFYRFSAERGAGFGSIWFVLDRSGHPVSALGPSLDVVVALLLVAALLAIAVLVARAPVRPRVAQVAFLAVAAFLLLNKVWSPQYALWLLPLAALARPSWRDIAVWQAGEVVYFFAVWFYLLGGFDDHALPAGAYYLAVVSRAATLGWLVAVVVRDVRAPGRDVVRARGLDDPAGGVLDGAADRGRPRRRRVDAGLAT